MGKRACHCWLKFHSQLLWCQWALPKTTLVFTLFTWERERETGGCRWKNMSSNRFVRIALLCVPPHRFFSNCCAASVAWPSFYLSIFFRSRSCPPGSGIFKWALLTPYTRGSWRFLMPPLLIRASPSIEYCQPWSAAPSLKPPQLCPFWSWCLTPQTSSSSIRCLVRVIAGLSEAHLHLRRWVSNSSLSATA